MRWAWALLMLASCAPPQRAVQLVLDAPQARTLVVFQSAPGYDADPQVVDVSAGDAIPAVITEDGELVETAVVIYAASPDALGLVPGPLPAAQGTPRVALPRPRVVRTAAYSGGDTEVVHLDVPAQEPERISTFRYAVPCPSAPVGAAPLAVIEGCPLAFAPREPACWGPVAPLAGLERPGDVAVGSVVREGAQTWLYLSSDRFGEDSFSRHSRVRLVDARTADVASMAALPTLPPLSRSAAGWEIRGWADAPRVRRDGLEMWFGSSYPDQMWRDQDAYVSTRSAVDAPWPLGTNAIAVGSALLEADGIANPILLLDDHTLVWERGGEVVVGWRSETRAGSADFVALGVAVDEGGERVRAAEHLALSCDGGHLLYEVDGRPYLARITAMPTAEDGRPSGRVVLAPRLMTELPTPPRGVETLSEAPDCAAMYLSDHRAVFVSERVPCAE